MAKTYGILAADSTALTSIGTVRNLKIDYAAEVAYSHDANGEPDGDDGGHSGPTTFSAQLEVDGTIPAVKSTIALHSITFIITKVSDQYESAGGVNVVDIEGTEQKTSS